MLVVGIILTIIGVIAMFLFGFGTPGKDTAASNAAWESSLTIGSAVLTGVGVLLILMAIVRRRRRSALTEQGRLAPLSSARRAIAGRRIRGAPAAVRAQRSAILLSPSLGSASPGPRPASLVVRRRNPLTDDANAKTVRGAPRCATSARRSAPAHR